MPKDGDIMKLSGEWFMYYSNIEECENCGEDVDFSGYINIDRAVKKIASVEGGKDNGM